MILLGSSFAADELASLKEFICSQKFPTFINLAVRSDIHPGFDDVYKLEASHF